MTACVLTILMKMPWDKHSQIYVITFVEGSVLSVVRIQIGTHIRQRAEMLVSSNGHSQFRRSWVQSLLNVCH